MANLSRTQLAEKLGLPKSRITKILDGESNLTLKTFAKIGLACGVRWNLIGTDAEDSRVIVTAPEGIGYDSFSNLGAWLTFNEEQEQLIEGVVREAMEKPESDPRPGTDSSLFALAA